MGQYFSGQAYGNTFGTLCQQQRKLDGKGDRLTVSAIVTGLPVGGVGIKDYLQGKFRKTRLYVTRCGGRIAGYRVAPVALAFDE